MNRLFPRSLFDDQGCGVRRVFQSQGHVFLESGSQTVIGINAART